ncbi:hypothetical protein BpHYR1_028006 [Brachionus plicatilis]|uniref:Uncharacterized protein n=1 Tax=Brachionus plicatilis TaxID=10195 RepID=A0A3M7RKP1_BRAPC|nr:hypothetical protein BpHYR1_028006 [Brachionus plicatilis]
MGSGAQPRFRESEYNLSNKTNVFCFRLRPLFANAPDPVEVEDSGEDDELGEFPVESFGLLSNCQL